MIEGEEKSVGNNGTNLRWALLVRSVAFYIVFWLFLFVPAGSIAYWQAWVCWAVFCVSSLAISLWFLKRDPGLIERRLRGGPGAENEPGQKIIQAFMALFCLLIVVVPGLDYRFGWSEVPGYAIIMSVILLILGFYIVFLTFRENSYTSAIIEVRSGQTVTSTGPYALIRHPMYAGAILIIAATPLTLGSWWALLFVPLLIAGIVWRLLDEEKFLSLNLPGYLKYCKKTRFRLVPGVW